MTTACVINQPMISNETGRHVLRHGQQATIATRSLLDLCHSICMVGEIVGKKDLFSQSDVPKVTSLKTTNCFFNLTACMSNSE